MSAPHLYHQPNAPDPGGRPDDDGESDLELDLQELDPISAHSRNESSSSRPSAETSRFQGFGGRIPLRNLRAGRARNVGQFRDGRNTQDTDAEDLRGLLEDEDTKRSSAGSRDMADDETFLAPFARGRRRNASGGVLSSLRSSLRLPSFSSTTGPSALDDATFEDGSEDAPEHDPGSNRTIAVGLTQPTKFPENAVSNAKYTPWSFLPLTLYHEFSFFYNMYYLLVALSQVIPALRVGYLLTYILPLAFVISITLGKEALDDVSRRRRDAEANSKSYTVLAFEEQRLPNDTSGKKASTKKKRKFRVSSTRNMRSASVSAPDLQTVQSTVEVFEIKKASRNLKVGDVVKLKKDERVPADLVLLKTFSSDIGAFESLEPPNTGLLDTSSSITNEGLSELVAQLDSKSTQNEVVQGASEPQDAGGEAFIRTDQLDGETDWKMRLASQLTQQLSMEEFTRLRVTAGKPDKKVNEFIGTIELIPKTEDLAKDPGGIRGGGDSVVATDQSSTSAPLTIDNTAWANTVIASNCSVLGVVIYTGPQTRQALSTAPSRSKTGLLEYEINSLTKILCIVTLALALLLVALEGFEDVDNRKWYIAVMRFLILFSTIVPISMRVNLDLGKSVYAWFIEHDEGIPGTIVRTSTIPEDLGRIEYLLSDKTGTLTQNGELALSPFK